jgi:hypothetical protein
MATSVNDRESGVTHHLVHEWGGETAVGERIVTAVAGYEDEDRASLPALTESINPTALDALFEDGPDGTARPGCVTFTYCGYTVVVQSTGRVLLRRD